MCAVDGDEAFRHLCKWLGAEATLPLAGRVLTGRGLEKKLAEEQVFQVEDLMLRDESMLQTVYLLTYSGEVESSSGQRSHAAPGFP